LRGILTVLKAWPLQRRIEGAGAGMTMTMHDRMMAGHAEPVDPEAEPCMDPPPAIGTDERRMHVRAYNYWASLLGGRAFPAIEDLKPATIGDFGAHGVLLDFTDGSHDPAIPWLGRALRDEGGHEGPVRTLADVADRSLLSRLTDHFADVVANRAPIGFEAEFENVRGNHALYRGILMPFSSDGATIDYIYGVINWKEVASAGLVAGIAEEVARALPPMPRATVTTPGWADGPSRPADGIVARIPLDDAAARLTAAREAIDLARSTERRARTALYRALGLVYDVMLAENATNPGTVDRSPAGRQRLYARITELFGRQEPRRQRIRYAAVLAHALRRDIGMGGLRMMLEQQEDGLTTIVAAERAALRTEARAAA
jgi:hypothetical protein